MSGIEEHCGVVAVHGPDAARMALDVLSGLQHRGRESAGLVCKTNSGLVIEKGLGTVYQAINSDRLPSNAYVAIAQTRYSTTADSTLEHAQPNGNHKSLHWSGHNGDIPNFVLDEGLTDSEVAHRHTERRIARGYSKAEALESLMRTADGAYSMVFLFRDGTVAAIRDPQGFKPLCVGRIGDNIVVSSESIAIMYQRLPNGERVERPDSTILFDVKPGEMVWVEKGNIRRKRLVESTIVTTCAFEYVYFSRSASNIDDVSVRNARFRMGERLAEIAPVEADIVVPVLGSGEEFARGFSHGSGIRYVEALLKNGEQRVFMDPDAAERQGLARKIHTVLEPLVRGKRVVSADDSIVRGDTSTVIISMLREAGASEVHVRSGFWEVKYPCYTGVDFHAKGQLIASEKTVEQIRETIGADSLAYLSINDVKRAIGRNDLCTGCADGNYPLRDSTLSHIQRVEFKSTRQRVPV